MTYQEFKELFENREHKEPVIEMSPAGYKLYTELLEAEAKRFIELQKSLEGKHFTRRFKK